MAILSRLPPSGFRPGRADVTGGFCTATAVNGHGSSSADHDRGCGLRACTAAAWRGSASWPTAPVSDVVVRMLGDACEGGPDRTLAACTFEYSVVVD